MNGKLVDTNVIIRYIKDEDALDDIFEMACCMRNGIQSDNSYS